MNVNPSLVETQLSFNYEQLKNSHANEFSFNWSVSTRIQLVSFNSHSTGQFQLAFNWSISVELQLCKQVDQLKNSHANEFSFNW